MCGSSLEKDTWSPRISSDAAAASPLSQAGAAARSLAEKSPAASRRARSSAATSTDSSA